MKALEAGAHLHLMFQSIAGTEKAMTSFGVTLPLLQEAWDMTLKLGQATGPNVMYFETGQGSALSADAHHGVDQQTLEARNYGLARHFDPFLVNTVVGFIGPEYLYDARQITRAGLEDHFMRQAPSAFPWAATPATPTTPTRIRTTWRTSRCLLTAAGCNFFMGLPDGRRCDVELPIDVLSRRRHVAAAAWPPPCTRVRNVARTNGDHEGREAHGESRRPEHLRVRRIRALSIGALVALGCAAGVPEMKTASSSSSRASVGRTRAPGVELFFKGDQPWARRGSEEWSLGDVHKDEMVFSPDGKRFAYVRARAQAAAGKGAAASAHVLVRNLAGDPVNDFAVYRPGMPDKLSWLDNRRLGYLAAPDANKHAMTYVVHDADTGEVLAARSGNDFAWDPSKRHVASSSASRGSRRSSSTARTCGRAPALTKLHGEPVWSADGHGLAIVDEGAGAPRLVVLVEFDDPQGDLTWPVPRDALAPGLKVFWASDSKVVIGESTLKPKFAAGWERLQ